MYTRLGHKVMLSESVKQNLSRDTSMSLTKNKNPVAFYPMVIESKNARSHKTKLH